MIGLSRTTGYAIRTLCCLAGNNCRTRSLDDIAKCAGVPRSYLAKIVNTLAHSGVVATKRGVGGGITLARPAKNIDLLQIVVAVEGPEWITGCLLNLGEGECGETCPTHKFWAKTRDSITTQLRSTTLAAVLKADTPASPRTAPKACACSN